MKCCILLSHLVCLIKLFKHRLNFHQFKLQYPDYLLQNNIIIYSSKLWLILVEVYLLVNLLSDVFIYLVIFFVQLVADIGMVVQLRRTFLSQMDTSASQDKTAQTNKKKKQDKAVNRTIVMVILNTSANIIFKFPSCWKSFYDMLYNFNIFFTSDRQDDFGIAEFHVKYCAVLQACELFDSCAKLLFMISLPLNIVFFLKFDKKFETCFSRVFHMKSNKNNSRSA